MNELQMQEVDGGMIEIMLAAAALTASACSWCFDRGREFYTANH